VGKGPALLNDSRIEARAVAVPHTFSAHSQASGVTLAMSAPLSSTVDLLWFNFWVKTWKASHVSVQAERSSSNSPVPTALNAMRAKGAEQHAPLLGCSWALSPGRPGNCEHRGLRAKSLMCRAGEHCQEGKGVQARRTLLQPQKSWERQTLKAAGPAVCRTCLSPVSRQHVGPALQDLGQSPLSCFCTQSVKAGFVESFYDSQLSSRGPCSRSFVLVTDTTFSTPVKGWWSGSVSSLTGEAEKQRLHPHCTGLVSWDKHVVQEMCSCLGLLLRMPTV
jgi:hypothetical protein